MREVGSRTGTGFVDLLTLVVRKNKLVGHIPSDLVVNRWACDGESGSHRDILCRLDVWTLARRQISCKITPVLSMVWHFTTKSDGICHNQRACHEKLHL